MNVTWNHGLKMFVSSISDTHLNVSDSHFSSVTDVTLRRPEQAFKSTGSMWDPEGSGDLRVEG